MYDNSSSASCLRITTLPSLIFSSNTRKLVPPKSSA
jgi:hypothetical protein